MKRRQVCRTAAVAAAALLAGAGMSGCSSSGRSAGSAASSAVSAAQSAAQSALASGASQLSSAAGGLASSVASAIASAQAAASSALASIKGGLDAKEEVTIGTVVTGTDGRSDAPLTIVNHQSESSHYTIEVDFKDQSGQLVDAVVVDVPDVAAGATAEATARSDRSLPSPVTAVVSTALRY
ncbi:hypothetical protein [Kitasatospora sp. GP82]|uniref:hypothetical protein n=1 Tax=Kitasatospora sp. GP82 TaxID=3035089 RepID=UPI002473F1D4|nr:hypothetical protein [Kitasatospora sp. GP82]MDH6126793.1 hypothetical protein [Kitasatospora sp. GP82]